jgi:hypothetical protein
MPDLERRVLIGINSHVLAGLDLNEDPVHFELNSMPFFADRAIFISSTTPASQPNSN